MLVERSLPECVGDYEPPGTSSCCSSTGWKLRATELIQYRIPVVSRGPSLKRCPRWAPQFLQTTSVRRIKSELSSCNSTFSLLMCSHISYFDQSRLTHVPAYSASLPT